MGEDIGAGPCHWLGLNQAFQYTKSQRLVVHGVLCLDTLGTNGPVKFVQCLRQVESQIWHYDYLVGFYFVLFKDFSLLYVCCYTFSVRFSSLFPNRISNSLRRTRRVVWRWTRRSRALCWPPAATRRTATRSGRSIRRWKNTTNVTYSFTDEFYQKLKKRNIWYDLTKIKSRKSNLIWNSYVIYSPSYNQGLSKTAFNTQCWLEKKLLKQNAFCDYLKL